MSSIKKMALLISILGVLLLPATAQAAIVSTAEALSPTERHALIKTLEQKEIQQQLIALGVNSAHTLTRVNHLSDKELIQLRDNLKVLPAGAGISTVDLLLVIILILLLL